MSLKNAQEGTVYKVRSVDHEDGELTAFLFSLGCYEGSDVTLVSHLKKSCIIKLKNGRYCIDHTIAESIRV